MLMFEYLLDVGFYLMLSPLSLAGPSSHDGNYEGKRCRTRNVFGEQPLSKSWHCPPPPALFCISLSFINFHFFTIFLFSLNQQKCADGKFQA